MDKQRIDDIRKRIAKRKEQQQRKAYTDIVTSPQYTEEFSIDSESIFDEDNKETHPLFKKEVFLFKLLCSVCLVLLVAILFKNTNEDFDKARSVVTNTMKKEFQFATVSDWYKQQFGEPLSFFPSEKKEKSVTQKEEYAVPASGKVMQTFEANGQGVFVQTGLSAVVDAVNEGLVIFVGSKPDLGNTVVIQHADGTESWYGNLENMSVSVYEYVQKEQKLGTVANSNDGKSGKFYFALKKDEKFIDPIPVISFE
ncbi:M23 family metallopeptidase [Bacillus sp. 165]|uniref:M23 family metallopeptidase n=1 Tax=Bacillus sp. 165 TaxID=1529117 RepID=UPI001ADB9D7F|nr:M23 family metallopeptidase [Bacillus sp. 165]MBO9130502.1 M23 family metallopeptidase [Bacillus sp. 165]